MDVVKTRLQAQSQALSNTSTSATTGNNLKHRYRGTVDAFRKIGSHEGPLALWRGLGPALVMTVPSTTIYFSLYEIMKHDFDSKLSMSHWSPLLAGCIARTMAVAVTSPIDLFRTNLQSHSRQVGSMTLFKNIVRSGRWSTFWVGVRPTLWRDVPFSGIYWTCFEALRLEIAKSGKVSSNFVNALTSGAIAGAVAAIVTLPFDVLKTRTQMNVDRVASGKMLMDQLPTSTFGHMSEIVHREGARALFQGLWPRVFKIAPSCAIMISSYELIKDIFTSRRNLSSSEAKSRRHPKVTPVGHE